MSIKRSILVVGATGKQGTAFISSVRQSRSSNHLHIIALTRSPSAPTAKALVSDQVQVVQGDLDNPDSIRQVFQGANEHGGIWGVFLVLAFPGLGADASGEEKQGILLTDLAVEFGVKHFVFSSVERGDEDRDDKLEPDRMAKAKIERYIYSQEGLQWTILRPTFFMENFDGFIGKITTSVLRCGLEKDTTLQLIAAEDVGHVARVVFEAPENHTGQVIVVIGDCLTTEQQAEAFKRGAGRSLPSVANFIGKALLAINKHTKNLVADIERIHKVRSEGSNDELLAQCRALHPGTLTFEQWARRRRTTSERREKWNNVTFYGLVTGKG